MNGAADFEAVVEQALAAVAGREGDDLARALADMLTLLRSVNRLGARYYDDLNGLMRCALKIELAIETLTRDSAATN